MTLSCENCPETVLENYRDLTQNTKKYAGPDVYHYYFKQPKTACRQPSQNVFAFLTRSNTSIMNLRYRNTSGEKKCIEWINLWNQIPAMCSLMKWATQPTVVQFFSRVEHWNFRKNPILMDVFYICWWFLEARLFERHLLTALLVVWLEKWFLNLPINHFS